MGQKAPDARLEDGLHQRCFDLLHPGHVRYLEARSLGDATLWGATPTPWYRASDKVASRPATPEDLLESTGVVSYCGLAGSETP